MWLFDSALLLTEQCRRAASDSVLSCPEPSRRAAILQVILEHLTNLNLVFLPKIFIMESNQFDIIIVGGGVVGLAAAYKINIRYPDKKILVLEKENEVA